LQIVYNFGQPSVRRRAESPISAACAPLIRL